MDVSPPFPGGDRVIKPREVEFVSYPYEWAFGQLRAAALATLEIQSRAVQYGMSLRDASAYNIQFVDGRPTLIDTASFEIYEPGRPWVAYRQFCEHFLGPLALMAFRDPRLAGLLRTHIDGIPLDLAAALLPSNARIRPGLLLHVVAHARSQRRRSGRTDAVASSRRTFGETALRGLVDSLKRTVSRLSWRPAASTWTTYYADGESYSPAGVAGKRDTVARFLDRVRPRMVWDLGANTGAFSRLAASKNVQVVAFEGEPSCVEAMYRENVDRGETRLLPLVMDLANPSPSLGWAHDERMSLRSRGPADVVMALALVHHLAIGNNVPLPRIAEFLADLGRFVILEFVPREDPQVQRLLASRQHDFPDYAPAPLEAALVRRFEVRERAGIPDSRRTLYLLERRLA
ncbi:MAG TPA: SAM-dependent methyltransferase [Candidatus Tectomicrobia bacterium]|nr:SAM-dependent methyltransferase [Candidatus Tectomicrobia bacterium]